MNLMPPTPSAQARADAIRDHNRSQVASSRRRNNYYAEKVRGRAIELAGRWVREHEPEVWLQCMKESRAHVDARRGEQR